ncbi:hypothetical protein [Ruegeria arenilitoris]|uniref:hypothetical protein n=1 Tax=Ruegeria arenilitoris TaxID=1173585 RepID=UPI00147AA5B1|nr:hypothetical protein [Ruegeria arenilitoris]
MDDKDSYHPSQIIRLWNNDRLLGQSDPRNASVYAPVVLGVTGVEGGPSFIETADDDCIEPKLVTRMNAANVRFG